MLGKGLIDRKIGKLFLLKAMEQPDHMIDMLIILSVNFCLCRIIYQVKNW